MYFSTSIDRSNGTVYLFICWETKTEGLTKELYPWSSPHPISRNPENPENSISLSRKFRISRYSGFSGYPGFSGYSGFSWYSLFSGYPGFSGLTVVYEKNEKASGHKIPTSYRTSEWINLFKTVLGIPVCIIHPRLQDMLDYYYSCIRHFGMERVTNPFFLYTVESRLLC